MFDINWIPIRTAKGMNIPLSLSSIMEWRRDSEGLYNGCAVLPYGVYITLQPHEGAIHELRSMSRDGHLVASEGDECVITTIMEPEELVIVHDNVTGCDFTLASSDAKAWIDMAMWE